MDEEKEPRREMPRELYPEWTTHPHRRGQQAVQEPPLPVRAEAVRRSPWAFLLLLAALAAAFFVIARERGGFQRGDRGVALDSQIEEAARMRLKAEPSLESADVIVVVREQVATVSGRVPDDATRERVLNVVRMTPNLSGVIDKITVVEARPAK